MKHIERRYSLDSMCEWFAHPGISGFGTDVNADPAKQNSVLVVDIGEPENEPILTQRLMERITSHVPGCQRINWDDDTHIAVFCPDTDVIDVSQVNRIAAMTVATITPGSNNAVVTYTYQSCNPSGEQ